MCGRVNLADLSFRELADWLEHGIVPDRYKRRASWNVPPMTEVPIIRAVESEVWEVAPARWGLIPAWHRKSLKEWKAASFNARVETVATAAAFRDAYRRGRCVQPIAGYYEWHKGEDGAKQPFYIRPGDNAPGLWLAAIYTEVNLPDFSGFTCATLTEPATGSIAQIHDRMPVMLDRQGVEMWMAGVPVEDIPRLPMSRLRWHQVSPAVGSVKNDSPDLIEPADATD